LHRLRQRPAAAEFGEAVLACDDPKVDTLRFESVSKRSRVAVMVRMGMAYDKRADREVCDLRNCRFSYLPPNAPVCLLLFRRSV